MAAPHHATVKRIRLTHDMELSAWKCDNTWEAYAEAYPKGSKHHPSARLAVGEAFNCDTQVEARVMAVFRLASELFGHVEMAQSFDEALKQLRTAADAAFNARCGL